MGDVDHLEIKNDKEYDLALKKYELLSEDEQLNSPLLDAMLRYNFKYAESRHAGFNKRKLDDIQTTLTDYGFPEMI
jgi:hypothetical protein